MKLRIWLLLSLSILISSCDNSTESNKQKIELLSYKVPCVGVNQQLCYLIVNDISNQNELFYSSIENFHYVWGHSYKLSTVVTEIDNPAADASSRSYKLDEILADDEDEVGTIYEFKLIELLDFTFTKDSLNYYFLGKKIECASEADCDQLIALNNSGGLINVFFEYLGQGKIELVSWN